MQAPPPFAGLYLAGVPVLQDTACGFGLVEHACSNQPWLSSSQTGLERVWVSRGVGVLTTLLDLAALARHEGQKLVSICKLGNGVAEGAPRIP